MTDFDTELLTFFMEEANDSLTKWESLVIEIEKNPSSDAFNNLFRIAHNLKGASRSVNLMKFGEFIHLVEDGITLLCDQKIECSSKHIDLLFQVHSIMSDWLGNVGHNPSYGYNFEEFKSGFIKIFSLETDKKSSSTANSAQEQKVEVKDKPKLKKNNGDDSVRVSATKLDQLIQIIGELSIHQSIIWHARNSELKDASGTAQHSIYLSKKLTRELYDQALSLRMLPVQPLFQRIERSARELAKDLGKKINISFSGETVELDKTVLEKIIDPLTHIIRNAIDHGIEDSDIRLVCGKAEDGHILISAENDIDGVSIIIKDDGKGMDPEKLKQKAIEKGLLPTNAVLNPEECYNLIMLPGFSTAEKVTSVSGRGVGMDVMKKSVEDLKGKVYIQSSKGEGTTFTISLPTSLSLVDSLVINLSGLNYAIPVASIDEIINIKDHNLSEDKLTLSVRGQILSFQYLEDFLPPQMAQPAKYRRPKIALIAKNEKHRMVFVVDGILGQQQVVVRQLTGELANVFGFSGGSIFATGEPGLIIDLQSIVKKYFSTFVSKEIAA